MCDEEKMWKMTQIFIYRYRHQWPVGQKSALHTYHINHSLMLYRGKTETTEILNGLTYTKITLSKQLITAKSCNIYESSRFPRQHNIWQFFKLYLVLWKLVTNEYPNPAGPNQCSFLFCIYETKLDTINFFFVSNSYLF